MKGNLLLLEQSFLKLVIFVDDSLKERCVA
jgi:hypothetical protein